MSQQSNRPVDWEEFVTQQENRLYRAALAILGHPQEAEDAVQDAFVRYLEKAPVHLENPGAWIMRVLVNGCKSRLRLKWRQVMPLPETLPVPGPEERQEVEELFSLPPKDRAVLHLFYYEGYSTQQIAVILSMPKNTVCTRLSRARQLLRQELEEVTNEV